MNIELLKNDWLSQTRTWSNDEEKSLLIFDELIECYQSEKRYYHTLEHINSMLLLLERFKQEVRSYEKLFFATWFHDAIQGLDIDGETHSALMLMDRLEKIGVPYSILLGGYQLIIATKNHEWSGVQDVDMFLDIDMSILGSDKDTYQKYASNVRKEYSSISDSDYAKGRSHFLQSLLKKDSIFLTEIFIERYEQRARENILEELKTLN